GDQIGTPLALVDSSEIKAALIGFPLIETYALEARPPHDLTVRIVERTPVGVLRSDAGYTLVDAAGVALATTTDQPAGQPLLDIAGGTDSSAFESAGLVVRSLPADVRAQLTGVRATTADDVTLTLSSGLTVVWGSEDESATKGIVLARALAANPGAGTIDVSSPNAAVVG
ncbi:MAG: cell division protein FtsQ/DivIB, partial [Microbacterium sp.]|nr:cell division protein FtsQ/DivIB [Microbacterium sp.]